MTLTEFRRKKKISQIEMGRRIGVSGRAVSSYETKGRRLTLEIAHKMAVELGITLDEMYELVKEDCNEAANRATSRGEMVRNVVDAQAVQSA